MDPQETIAKRMRRLRHERNLSLKEAAARIGVPTSTYKEWEYGRAIQGEPYERIAKCFGISLQELISGRAPDIQKQQLSERVRCLKECLTALERELLALA